jgi:hypothetical protein
VKLRIFSADVYALWRVKPAVRADKILIDWPWCKGFRPSAIRAQFRKVLEHARLLRGRDRQGRSPCAALIRQIPNGDQDGQHGRDGRTQTEHYPDTRSPPSPPALCNAELRPVVPEPVAPKMTSRMVASLGPGGEAAAGGTPPAPSIPTLGIALCGLPQTDGLRASKTLLLLRSRNASATRSTPKMSA